MEKTNLLLGTKNASLQAFRQPQENTRRTWSIKEKKGTGKFSFSSKITSRLLERSILNNAPAQLNGLEEKKFLYVKNLFYTTNLNFSNYSSFGTISC